MSSMEPNTPTPEPTNPIAPEPPTPAVPSAQPIAQAQAAPAETPAVQAPAATQADSSTGKKILLVEDDDSLASVYVTRLEAEGFTIRRVANGEEALAAALEYHPQLVLLDVMMPKVSGFDVLDILRNTPETAQLKVIMLTALSQDSDVERARALGVDDYLVKSQVVISDVIDRIRFHINK